jgi:hydroxylamine reductase (hybrid-cluster protein)
MTITQKDKLKKIVFTATEKSHADLKIKLHYDGLTQVNFYRMMMEGYIKEDERILEYVQDWKDQNETQSKRQRNDIKKEYKDQKELKEKFALNETEVESIFDMLEMEHPDL